MLLLLLLVAHVSFAQTFRGGIAGTLTDAAGNRLASAQIIVTEEATSVAHNVVSSSAGEYALRDLPAGKYTVAITAPGFETRIVHGVQITAGNIAAVDAQLSVAKEETTVNVVATSLTLDTESSTQSTVLDQQVQDTPIAGRDFLQFTALQPGFAGYQNQASGAVNGSRRNGINFQIDGTDNNDLWHNIPAVNQGGVAGIAGTELPIDAIQEYTLQTNAGSESGRNPGGTVNLAIKSGTNQLHGSAYEYIRNEALAVENPFLPAGYSKPQNRSENRGFTFGGPVLPNRLFYFVAFEYQEFSINPDAVGTVPGTGYQTIANSLLAEHGLSESSVSRALLNNLWPSKALAASSASTNNYFSPDNEFGFSYNWLVKIDHHINSRNDLSFHWFAGQGNQTAPVGSSLVDYYQVAPLHDQNYSLVLNTVLTPSLTNQVQFGVSYFNQIFHDKNNSQDVGSLGLVTGSRFSKGAPNIAVGNFDQVGLTPPEGRSDLTGHVGDALTWTFGKHVLRSGSEYRRAQIDEFYFLNSLGQLTFNGKTGPWSTSSATAYDATVDSYSKALADFLIGSSSSSSIQDGNQERWVYENTFALFAQDTYHVSTNLTVNYGLRYDYTGPFFNGDKNLSVFDNATAQPVFLGDGLSSLRPHRWADFSPRAGFNYSPNWVKNTVLRGGAGIYFDTPNLNPFLSNSPGNGAATGVQGNPGGADPVAAISNPGTEAIVSGQNFFANATSASLLGGFSVSRNFQTPVSYNYYLQVERSLSGKGILQVGYVGSQSRHLITLFDINSAALNTSGSVVQSSRPFTGWKAINELRSNGNSNYNSLQALLRSQDWHGVTAQAAYTWAHNLDELTQYRNTYALPQINNVAGYDGLKLNYGNSDYDVRNTLTSVLSYRLPKFAHGPQRLVNGWQANSLLSFHTGLPFTVRNRTLDNSGTGDKTQFAALVAGQNPRKNVTPSSVKTKVQWLNTAAFAQPAAGTYSFTQRRNQIWGPGYSDVDFSLFKETPITERVNTQFRAEFYNIFNRTNLGSPSATYASGSNSFGSISQTIGAYNSAPGIGPGEPFNVQLALKILF
ncbi:MAG: carboxypeptidase regulatory-like domain-containing protein [Terracidiphilus sp.]|nr:carboxypeptidase regulatory-like domain-containing protein [Terracidiphilus sp.]